MSWGASAALIIGTLMLAGCSRQPATPIENVGSGPDLSGFSLNSIKGTRDGERLDVRAVYGDGTRGLTLDLRFKVAPQARLESGSWSGLQHHGTVRERSVTFLGGQSGPPNIGGRFDLLGPDDRPIYRVNLPVQPLQDRL